MTFGGTIAGPARLEAADKAPSERTPRAAIEPAAPALPPEIIISLQSGTYADAAKLLAAVREKASNRDDSDYFSYIKAISERLGGQTEAALGTLTAALEANPDGRWASKIRIELAGIEQLAGNLPAAEKLTREEATRLLSGPRKDQLATIYRDFAQSLLQPSDPQAKPDAGAARELLGQARDLAESPELRAKLLFEMARAALAVPDIPGAIQLLESHLREYPQSPDRFAVRYWLAEGNHRAKQEIAARLAWSDLASDLERMRPADRTADLAAIHADALFGIATTHGIPNPADDRGLNLGIAALRRFLTAFPANDRSVRAAYSIGASYLSRQRAGDALEAFNRFVAGDGFRVETEAARRDWAELVMTSSFQIAQIERAQANYAEAIAAWKAYLTRYPNGPQTADAQQEILSTELLIATDHLNRARHPEARAAFGEFAARNPLDPRVPTALFQIGDSYAAEKKFDQAIAAWQTLIARYGSSEPAAHAQFETAMIVETEKGNPTLALEQLKKITVEPWASEACQRVAVLESRALLVVTPRVFRSGEQPILEITTRNIEKLSFTAYKLNSESYFRKKAGLDAVESLDIGLVAPDAAWTSAVPNQAQYRTVQNKFTVDNCEFPGVYVVKVTDEKHLQATTLVIGSDVDAIIKSSREQFLVYAQDMKTGRARAGARVLIADADEVIAEGATGPDGVLVKVWDVPRAANETLSYLILDGPHVAGSDLGIPHKISQGLNPRAYLMTDRPAYRPGQSVAIRGVVREVALGQYTSAPGALYRLEVADSQGRLIIGKPITLSEFGTFHDSLALDKAAPLGDYQIRLYQPGKSVFSGGFTVQAYRLEPIALSFDFPRTVYYRGETIKGEILARYHYGAPVSSRPIELDLPGGKVLRGMTSASGTFPIELETTEFAEEQTLPLVARLPRDNVAAAANFQLASREFEISLDTTRELYLDGETFQLGVTTVDALGKPTGQSVAATVIKLIDTAGKVSERNLQKKSVETDSKTGKGSLTFKIDDSSGGRYILRASGTDRFRNPIVADRAISISGKGDPATLHLLADRLRYKVGEDARIRLHTRGRVGPALVTWEADRILSYKIVTLVEGENTLEWPVDNLQFPNFTITATRMWRDQLDRAVIDLQVDRDLRVSIVPKRPTVGPGEPIELDIETVDQLGRPVSAELSLAMVDKGLLSQFADRLPSIGSYFYNQTRTGAFATRSTNTFRYAPDTLPVALAVVDEAERLAAQAANLAERGQAIDKARQGVLHAGVAPAGRKALGMGGGMVDMMYAPSPPGTDRAGRDLAKAKEARGNVEEAEAKSGEKAEWQMGFKFSAPRWGNRVGVARDAQYRERFSETAYWNPSVVTDKEGKAHISFKAPKSLSAYQITARGITGGDTLAGQSSTSVTVRKDFFVDLDTPTALEEGDKPQFITRVHHTSVAGKVDLRLAIYTGDGEVVLPKTIELKGDGVDEVVFDGVEIPDADLLRLTLSGTIGDQTDQVVAEIPIRPWGVPALASRSGTSAESTTAFLELAPGRTYENLEMLIALSPTLERMLIELALGNDLSRPVDPLLSNRATCLIPPPITLSDRAADLLAVTSAINYLHTSRSTAAAEAARLGARARDLASGLIAAQNPDGGWSWVAAEATINADPNNAPANHSNRLTTAAVVWALATAEPLGFVSEPKTLEHGVTYLKAEFDKLDRADQDTRAAILFALSTRKAASFEAANSLNRVRDRLSDPALAFLALTFANLDRRSLGAELVDILRRHGKIEKAASGPGHLTSWPGAAHSPAVKGGVETTALIAYAIARIEPSAPELKPAVEWLLANRAGMGWQPTRATGVALAALAIYYGNARAADDRYRLTVTVDDTQVEVIDVAGPTAGRVLTVPRKAFEKTRSHRIRFDMVGRGHFSYAATLTGFTRDFQPDQDPRTHAAVAAIERRVIRPSTPELDGKALDTGFSVAVNATPFENLAKEVALGGRARVEIESHRIIADNTPLWDRDFLIVTDSMPAGATLIEGSVKTTASSYTVNDGTICFYFPPDRDPGVITYDIHGFIPGRYRLAPTVIGSAYEPERYHLGSTGELTVLAPGEPATDRYRQTPDELYSRGKLLFQNGRFADAAKALEPLFADYSLTDAVARDAATMLLLIHLRTDDARKIVAYFEIVKEKAPDQILTFDQLLAVGKAYRDLNEYERAMIVWRGLIEASYLEDARIGELLRRRGKVLEAIAYLIDLWRSYPGTAAIDADFFGLSQVIARTAEQAINDSAIRRELAAAGVTRSALWLQSIRMVQIFLARSPDNPLADEASLALIGAFIDLEDFSSVVKLAGRFAKLYPKSSYVDAFQYSEALANFHLGQYDRAIERAKSIAAATYKDSAGNDQPSPNRWQSLYILGQIHDARRQPAQAINYYRQVADRFTDASSAIESYTRKMLTVPEVSIVRPAANKPAIGREQAVPKATATIPLSYRNIPRIDIKIYPVDLMQLYLTRRSLDGIAGIDLAGITPLEEKTIELGNGEDFADKTRPIELTLHAEGAYLVMIRGENEYASGIVLVTPLSVEAIEEPEAGRVRVIVRDAATGEPVPRVAVKVTGSESVAFISGETDLRGVFIAEGVQGVATTMARMEKSRYAFHRGTTHMGAPPAAPVPETVNQRAGGHRGEETNQALDSNLRLQNSANSIRQTDRLERRYSQPAPNAKGKGAAAGGFR
jgi:TolA-binding protein